MTSVSSSRRLGAPTRTSFPTSSSWRSRSPKKNMMGGRALFLWPHEIIHDEVLALQYCVCLRLVEYHDCHTPPLSLDEGYGGDSSDSGDNNYNGDWLGCSDRGGGGTRPRTMRFGDGDNPRLGPGSGPAFWPRVASQIIRVGQVACPVASARDATPRLSATRIPARCLTCVGKHRSSLLASGTGSAAHPLLSILQM